VNEPALAVVARCCSPRKSTDAGFFWRHGISAAGRPKDYYAIIGADELTADYSKRDSFNLGRLGAGFAPKTLKIALKPWKPTIEFA
jgi:hypothetical protein